jgi:mono/diheme cytochrome c family protein
VIGGRLVLLLLALILVSLIGVQWFIQPDPNQRNYEIFPNMVESVAYEPQRPALILEDGSTLDTTLPEGSVARGHLPIGFEATPEGALLAGQMLTNPIDYDDGEALLRGAFVFNAFCMVCHGPEGLGDGPVTKRGVPPPPSLLLEHAVKMTDGQMYHVLTLGQVNMASYASQVTQEDRWKAIRYIRKLQAVTTEAEE